MTVINNLDEHVARLEKLASIFTPSAPIKSRSVFAGRVSQLIDCYMIVNLPGAHAILHGDRGVGKTSVANIVMQVVGGEWTPIKVFADSKDTYESLFRSIFGKIVVYKKPPREELVGEGRVGFNADIETPLMELSLAETLGDFHFSAKNVAELLSRSAQKYYIIIDEFDRLTNKFSLSQFTETLKILSDTAAPVKFLVVGVGDDVQGIIGNHESIVRNLKQIKIPVMPRHELAEIIDKGMLALSMSIPEVIRDQITELSCGYPHYTHLLAYHCSLYAVSQGRSEIEDADFTYAVDKSISDSNENLKRSYQLATIANKQNIFREVLLACGNAPLDEYGTFQPKDVEKPLSAILKRQMKVNQFGGHLLKLCDGPRGRILVARGEKNRSRYQFRDPLMRAFVKLNSMKVGT